ncbi:hypothetical protein [Spirulina major]|uniref:hypothetical protein n=1 Tax=Spirulina major TaxID=270636 RepID=UPI001C318F8B|nr:hypothetical protein [Spirulina major]
MIEMLRAGLRLFHLMTVPVEACIDGDRTLHHNCLMIPHTSYPLVSYTPHLHAIKLN